MAQALHEHVAEQLPDGRIVVRGLPVLAEERESDPRFQRERAFRSRLEGRPARPRDRKWLQRCLSRLKERREKIGYPIPLTFRHSDDDPVLAGELIPTEIGMARVNPGEDPRPTLFMDHVFKDRASYEEFKAKYPYRSPELSPDYPLELDAVALLSAEAPYNKFASPTVKEMFRAERFYRSRRAIAGPAFRGTEGQVAPERQASAREPYAVAQAMANKGEITRKRVGEVGDAIRAGKNETQQVAATALGARGLHGSTTETEAPMADLGVAEAPLADAAGEIDVAPAGSTAEMTLGQLGTKLDKLIELHAKGMGDLMTCMKSFMEGAKKPEMQATDKPDAGTTEEALEAGGESAPAGSAPTEQDEDEKGPSADPAVYRALKVLRGEVTRMRASRETDAKTVAALNGEVLGLRKAQETVRVERERSALEKGARDRLAALGFAGLGAEDEKAIRAASVQGKVAVDALLAGYARAAQLAGPELPVYGTAEAAEQAPDELEGDADVAELLAQGGQVATAVKTLYRSWQGLSAKDRLAFGGDFKNMLYDRDETGAPVLRGVDGKVVQTRGRKAGR